MSAKKPQTPVPMRELVVLASMNLSEAFQGNLVWPVIPFMVEDLRGTKEDLGYYSGILGCAFSLAQFCSSFWWGKMSDLYGRRPILLCGLLGSMISILMFGFSPTYAFAVFSRALCGFLNGNLGVSKSYLGEITDSTNRPVAFSVLNFTWGLGSIVGPIAGGFLIQPAERYPSVFAADGLFGAEPYLLPCLVSGVISFSAVAFGYFMLPETKKWLALKEKKVEYKRASTISPIMDIETDSVPKVHSNWLHLVLNKLPKTKGSSKGYFKVHSTPELSITEDDQDLDQVDMASPLPRSATKLRTPIHLRLSHSKLERQNEGEIAQPTAKGNKPRFTPQTSRDLLPELDDAEEPVVETELLVHEPEAAAISQDEVKAPPAKELIRDPAILTSIGAYGTFALMYIFFDESFPLYCKASVESGGLAFSSQQIGMAMTAGGIFLILFQIFFFPSLAKRFGVLQLIRWSYLLLIPFFPIFPLSSFFMSVSEVMAWIYLLFTVLIKVSVGAMGFTAVNISVSNSSNSLTLGTINGVGQSVASLARALGPYLGGTIWAWSIDSTFPMHQFVLYFIISLITILGYVFFVKRMPTWLDQSREEMEKKQVTVELQQVDETTSKVFDDLEKKLGRRERV